MLSYWVVDGLEVNDPGGYFVGWEDPRDLWLADVALLDSRARRISAGVMAPGDLRGFLGRKYALHLSVEGVRMCCLQSIRPVSLALDGAGVNFDIKATKESDARIWIACPDRPRRGAIDFIYYVGYHSGDAFGRHKLTDHALRSAVDLIEVR